MFFFTHLILGLIIGELFENYLVAIIGAIILDIDHLWVYYKNGILFSFKKLVKTIKSSDDPYFNQRNYLHSIFTFIFSSLVIILVDKNIGIVFSLAYLSHLLLDWFDGSIFYPFYPIKWET